MFGDRIHFCLLPTLVAQESTDITWPSFPAYGAIFSDRDSHFKFGCTMVDFYNKQDYYGGMQGLNKNVSETQISWPLDPACWILGIFEILKLYWNHWDTKMLLDNTYILALYTGILSEILWF